MEVLVSIKKEVNYLEDFIELLKTLSKVFKKHNFKNTIQELKSFKTQSQSKKKNMSKLFEDENFGSLVTLLYEYQTIKKTLNIFTDIQEILGRAVGLKLAKLTTNQPLLKKHGGIEPQMILTIEGIVKICQKEQDLRSLLQELSNGMQNKAGNRNSNYKNELEKIRANKKNVIQLLDEYKANASGTLDMWSILENSTLIFTRDEHCYKLYVFSTEKYVEMQSSPTPFEVSILSMREKDKEQDTVSFLDERRFLAIGDQSILLKKFQLGVDPSKFGEGFC